MAMTLSSAMAPTALGSQRRRRSPTNSTNTNSGLHREEQTSNTDLYADEEKENKGNMADTTMRPGVRFAAFDAALQHSDQTINSGNSLFRSSVGSAWRRRTDAAVSGMGGTTRARSSFFPDSTDDDESAALAMRRSFTDQRRERNGGLPPAPTPTPTPTFAVIHIGDVQFPTTRTVLWDRRVLAGPFEVTTADVLPRVRITNRVLKQLYALVAEKSTRASSRLLGYATTDESVDVNESGCVSLSTLVHHKPDGGRRPLWMVPFYRSKPMHREDEDTEHTRMENAARVRYEATSGTSRSRDTRLPVEARGFVYQSEERNRTEIEVEIDVVVPSVQLQFRLIRNLPLLMTPLAASLLRCEFGSEIRWFGFLTLDRARKAVALLATDPLVLQRPIVGLWVYGVDVDDSNAADSIHVRHPYLLESCVRFLSSKIIKERAQVDVDTFLVAVYPGNGADPLPRFFECHAPRIPRSASPVAWRAASARSRCLAGVSSFKNDLELSVVLTSEQDVEQPALPVESKTPRDQYSTAKAQTPSALQDRPTEYEMHQAVRRDRPVRGHEQHKQREEPIDFDSMKSCCRSQQMLASQHQQMLEHQQCQLRDLKEQIAQLQQVLTETRAENARLLSASSSRSSASSSVEDDSHRVHERADIPDLRHNDTSTSVTVSRLSEDAEDVEEQSRKESNHLEHDTSMVSSLAFSAISDDSNESQLSSVSSSVVGTRLKTLVTTEQPIENAVTAGHDESDASKKQAGSPREPQTVGEIDNQEPPHIYAEDEADANMGNEDEGMVRQLCPFVPSTQRLRRRAQCERDEFDDESDASKISELLAERLRIPVTPNREEIVRGGALPTFGFSHGSSFSIPKIKYVSEIVTCDSDDDEEEEIRRIELKYRKRRGH